MSTGTVRVLKRKDPRLNPGSTTGQTPTRDASARPSLSRGNTPHFSQKKQKRQMRFGKPQSPRQMLADDIDDDNHDDQTAIREDLGQAGPDRFRALLLETGI